MVLTMKHWGFPLNPQTKCSNSSCMEKDVQLGLIFLPPSLPTCFPPVPITQYLWPAEIWDALKMIQAKMCTSG
jgi:hypothetical protein